MYWKPYVSVAQRKAKAKKVINKCAKKGETLFPVISNSRRIANSFWGEKWCNHIEQFADYDNRLPRGRTYIRSGSVIHLKITPLHVSALVMGSSLYQIEFDLKPMDPSKWEELKSMCTGELHSLIDLMTGEIPESIIQKVVSNETGLLPKESEITCACSCPDFAIMCKHVAAVLYGIAVRLDEEPRLFFTLRDVNPEELILFTPIPAATAPDILSGDEMEALFGVASEDKKEDESVTGAQFKELRKRLKLSAKECAFLLSTMSGSVYRWEETKGVLNLSEPIHKKMLAMLKIDPCNAKC